MYKLFFCIFEDHTVLWDLIQWGSYVATLRYLLSLFVPLGATRCYALYHSLSLVVPLAVARWSWLALTRTFDFKKCFEPLHQLCCKLTSCGIWNSVESMKTLNLTITEFHSCGNVFLKNFTFLRNFTTKKTLLGPGIIYLVPWNIGKLIMNQVNNTAQEMNFLFCW